MLTIVDYRNIRCLAIEDVSHIVLTCATFAKSGHTTTHHNCIMRRSVRRPSLVPCSLVASNGTGTLSFGGLFNLIYCPSLHPLVILLYLSPFFMPTSAKDGLRPLISSATRRKRARRSRNDKSPNLSFLDEIVSYPVQLMSFS